MSGVVREQYSKLLVRLSEIGWDEVRSDPTASKTHVTTRGYLVSLDLPAAVLVEVLEKALAYDALGAKMDSILSRFAKP